MATTTTHCATGRPAAATPVAGAALRAEWTKLRTLRSTWMSLAGAMVLTVFLGVVVPSTQMSQWDEMSPSQRSELDATSLSLVGVLFSTVILGSLAVRVVTGEHSTGMIRLTYSALPRRRHVLLAKAVVIAAVALPAALVANLAAFVAGQRVLSVEGVQTSLGEPGASTAVVFGALAVAATAILGVGLGAVMRRTAPATAVLSVAIIGAQLFSIAVPEGARRFLPGFALQATVTGTSTEDLLEPFAGVVVLTGYALAAMVIATVLVDRRDA